MQRVLQRKDSAESEARKSEQAIKDYANRSFESKLVSSSSQKKLSSNKSRNDAMANELSRSFDNR